MALAINKLGPLIQSRKSRDVAVRVSRGSSTMQLLMSVSQVLREPQPTDPCFPVASYWLPWSSWWRGSARWTLNWSRVQRAHQSKWGAGWSETVHRACN